MPRNGTIISESGTWCGHNKIVLHLEVTGKKLQKIQWSVDKKMKNQATDREKYSQNAYLIRTCIGNIERSLKTHHKKASDPFLKRTKDSKRQYIEEDVQMGNEHKKRLSGEKTANSYQGNKK